MSSLWATGDNITAKRRNREALRGLLVAPSFDVDNSQVVTVNVVPIDGNDILTTETTHYTATVPTILHAVQVTNNHTVERNVRVHLVGADGIRSVANHILATVLLPGQTIRFRGVWAMTTGHTIRTIAAATAANEVAISGIAIEVADVIEGIDIMPPVFNALTTSLDLQYICPATSPALVAVAHAWVTIVNTDATARTVTLEVRPSGQSTSAIYNILKRSLLAFETMDLGGPDDPIVLQPGDAIYATASAGAVVACRTTAIEYSSTP